MTRSTARSAAKKSTTDEGAEQAPAEESTTTKAAAKKAPAKKAARKAPARKAAAKTSPDRKTSEERSRPRRVRPAQIAEAAAVQLLELTGKRSEGIVGLERTDDGWAVQIEVVELRRIPATTDVLATYEVDVDDDGELTGYHRLNRFVRGNAEAGR